MSAIDNNVPLQTLNQSGPSSSASETREEADFELYNKVEIKYYQAKSGAAKDNKQYSINNLFGFFNHN